MIINILDIDCSDKDLFTAAITHPSYTQENQLSVLNSYERLEFFGDAVLKLYASEILLVKYPDYEEGKLSQIRSILISDSTIAQIAKEIRLDEIIRISKSEEKQGGRQRESNLACSFEAILGAYFLDNKIAEVKEFLNYQLSKYIDDININFNKYNAKATLQEYTQAKTKELPIYKTISIKGPDHEPIFEVEVIYDGKRIAIGTGTSKKDAQQNSAYLACKKLGIIEDEHE